MSNFRPGDWNCPGCSNHNFASRTTCKQCSMPAPAKTSATDRPGDWRCSQCTMLNFAKRTACFTCSTPRQQSSEVSIAVAGEKKTAAIDDGDKPTKKARKLVEISQVVPDNDDDDDTSSELFIDVVGPPKYPMKDGCDECEAIGSACVKCDQEFAAAELAATTKHASQINCKCNAGMIAMGSLCAACMLRSDAPVAPIADAPKKYFLAVDIERVGPDFKYGILAIGACFGTSDGTIIEQRAFCAKVPPAENFDPKCWSEFWSKYPEVLKRINGAATGAPITLFHHWLLELQIRFGPFGRKHKDKVNFKLVSDNPAYDIGMINLEFFKLGLTRSMAEMFDDYVPTDDPSEQVRAMTADQKKRVDAFIKAPHDHWPVNDATQIFQQRCGIAAVLDK